jgi:ATP-dependent helicase/nuclease subunit B
VAVQFVIGRAGSGKSERFYRLTVDALGAEALGPPIYWLLPRQATFSAERLLTCASGLGAFTRARVVSFDEFGLDVFESCGGSSIPQVTSLGRRMIIGHLLRRHRGSLRFYSQVARQPGLASELDATFAELERSGKSPQELDESIRELAESNAADNQLKPLLDKLHDARLLYEAYSAYLGQDRLDQHRRSMQVCDLVAGCDFLRKAVIYVDSFLDFTEYERQILVGIARAGARIEIALLMDAQSPLLGNPHLNPSELGLFRKTEDAYRRLHAAFAAAEVEIDEPLRLTKTHRFTTPGLRDVERDLFRDPTPSMEDAAGIRFIEAPDRAAEVDAVAREIQLLMRQGTRLRNIAVLARDLTRYQTLIEASFEEHGIAYFMDRRRPAGHHPLAEFVRNLFQIARHDWPLDAVMGLLRSGLAQVPLYDADGLENYVLAHRIQTAAGWEAESAWDFKEVAVNDEDESSDAKPRLSPAQYAEKLRRVLVDRLQPLLKTIASDQPKSVRTYATAVFAALDRFNVRQTLGTWIASSGPGERGAEHEQVWENLSELFQQMVDLLGDETMTPDEFYDVMEAGLDSFDLAIAPQTIDQVLIGQVDRTRTGPLDAVFVIGLNDGEFPQAASDGSIITDRDRRRLRERRIDLDASLRDRLLDERLLAYAAMTRASQRLIVTRPQASSEGRSAEPSSFWHRLSELFPAANRTVVPRTHGPAPQQIATPRQLVTGLMRWVRHPEDAASNDEVWPALYQWFAERSPAADDPITRLRFRAWRALQYQNTAALSPEIAAALLPSPLTTRVSRLETMAACPFQHFAQYTLDLRERTRLELTAQDFGRLYHQLLEDGLRSVLRRREQGEKVTLESVLDELGPRIDASLRESLMLGSARNRYLVDRTRQTTRRFARAQREVARRTSFRPTHVGVRFGEAAQLPAYVITTPSGSELWLEGKIDRVDRTTGGAFSVIDYSMGGRRLNRGLIPHGLSLQLLTSLLVLEAAGEDLSGNALKAAGAFYLQLVRRIESVKHPSEGADPAAPEWHLKIKQRGVFDERHLASFDKELTTGNSAVVQAFVKADGTLGRRRSSDAIEPETFRALLNATARKLEELTRQIFAGEIGITPYRLNDNSPCSRCSYRSVCRFDPAINKYNYLQPVPVIPEASEDADD